jgi:hypothetical protein
MVGLSAVPIFISLIPTTHPLEHTQTQRWRPTQRLALVTDHPQKTLGRHPSLPTGRLICGLSPDDLSIGSAGVVHQSPSF